MTLGWVGALSHHNHDVMPAQAGVHVRIQHEVPGSQLHPDMDPSLRWGDSVGV
jgi:hypothetical protein